MKNQLSLQIVSSSVEDAAFETLDDEDKSLLSDAGIQIAIKGRRRDKKHVLFVQGNSENSLNKQTAGPDAQSTLSPVVPDAVSSSLNDLGWKDIDSRAKASSVLSYSLPASSPDQDMIQV